MPPNLFPYWHFGGFSSSPICEGGQIAWGRFPCALNTSFGGSGGSIVKERSSVHRNIFSASHKKSLYKSFNKDRQEGRLSCFTAWYCYDCWCSQVTIRCSVLSRAPCTDLQSNDWGAKWLQRYLSAVQPRTQKTLESLEPLQLSVCRNTPGRCINRVNTLPTNAS